jgi:peptidoglycan/xylan/chitin deacetylase (PgdA/CDA1 family)
MHVEPSVRGEELNSFVEPSTSFGVMFHHFSSKIHPRGQGAISEDELIDILDYLESKYEILDCDVYQRKILEGTIRDSEICLTFDDALLSQVDVALPVLRKRNLKAFFFVYSSAFTGEPDPLEIFRYFRTTEYDSFNDFFAEFLMYIRKHFKTQGQGSAMDLAAPPDYLNDFPFYTPEDKQFRYIRDQILSKIEYHSIMRQMMSQRSFNSLTVADKVFMTHDDLKMLHSEGHEIGLHSHSHPTRMHTLSATEQQQEYERNLVFINSVTGMRPTTMSHPCGNYGPETLEILRSLNVNLGFRSSRAVGSAVSRLEIPREDHSNILAVIKK